MHYLIRLLTGNPKLTAERAVKLTTFSQEQYLLKKIYEKSKDGLFEVCIMKKYLCDAAKKNIEKRGFKVNDYENGYRITW